LIIKNAKGVDVTDKLHITKNDGSIKIKPAPLTVTTGSAEKVYDGNPLTKDEASIAGLVNNETATVTATGSQTDVGHSNNTYSLTWNGTAKEKNYTVSESLGTLTVTPASMEVTAHDYTGTYDGNAHGITVDAPAGATIKYSTSNSDNEADWSTTKPMLTHVGSETVYVKATKANYETKTAQATITINPAAITVTTPSVNKVYDGEALTAAGTISGFVNNETAIFTTTGTQTDVGTSSNTYTLAWTGSAHRTDYTVNETLGTLTVTENSAEIVVTTTGGEFTYDGQAHGATVTVSTLPKGYTLDTATSNASATNVTTNDVAATCNTLIIKNAKGVDVTDKLHITKNDGSIKIKPAPLTVTTGSAEKVYDGNPLTKDEASIAGLVNNETATVTATGSQTDAGSGSNTYEITWGNTNKDNYAITENLGTLKVNKRPITITAGSKSKIFDNLPLTYNFASLTNGTLADNQYAVYSASGTITNPGTAPNVPDVHIYIMETPTPAYAVRMMAVNEPVEVTDNYQIEKINGVLEVTAQTPTPNPPAADKYSLTINYVDQNGKTVADAYANQFNQNDPYSVDSPIITGYELVDSTQATVAGSMPGQNLTVTVVYKKTSTEPQNPKTPTTPANKPQSDKSADTGDGFSLITWMLLAMIGAAGAVGTGFAVRKREDDNE